MISGSSRIDEMKKNKTKGLFASIVLGVAVTACAPASSCGTVTVVDRPDIQSVNTNYIGNSHLPLEVIRHQVNDTLILRILIIRLLGEKPWR